MSLKRRSLLAAGALPLLSSPSVFAQADWPNRAVKVLVPSAAGGSADFWARAVCDKLSFALKQPFVVENRPGASGTIVTSLLAQARPDGYTLAMSFASALVPMVTLDPDAKYNWTHLQPIARFGSLGAMLIVTPDFPARTLKEFVAYVKANPGKLNYASYGIASGGHIVMEALKSQAGLDMQHVPYAGVPRVLTDMQAGLIKIGCVDPVTPLPFVRQGTFMALAVNGPTRLPASPEVPTMAEEGYPIYMPSWYGFFGPQGLPRTIVDRLNGEVGRIIAAPEMQERFKSSNTASTKHVTPEEFSAFIKSEVQVWGKVIKDANVTRH
jgi:tripartite-type tricarboxylate transporter receptor subunit TctC